MPHDNDHLRKKKKFSPQAKLSEVNFAQEVSVHHGILINAYFENAAILAQHSEALSYPDICSCVLIANHIDKWVTYGCSHSNDWEYDVLCQIVLCFLLALLRDANCKRFMKETLPRAVPANRVKHTGSLFGTLWLSQNKMIY